MIKTKGKLHYENIYNQIRALPPDSFRMMTQPSSARPQNSFSQVVYPPHVLEQLTQLFRKFQDRFIEDMGAVKKAYETVAFLEGEVVKEREHKLALQSAFDA